MKRIKKDNKGFSLVEMIVAILITSILMLGVSAFLQTSRVTYSKINTSSRLQEEAGCATEFVNELLIEATECGTTTATQDGKDLSVLWIKALENDPSSTNAVDVRKYSYYFIIFEEPAVGEETGYLRYKKVDGTDPDVTFVDGLSEKVINLPSDFFEGYVNNPYVTICEFITGMDLTKVLSTNGRMYKVEFSFLFNGENYISSATNYSRNNSFLVD